MSYILDALRRADAERQHGQVPGLHAQPVAAGGLRPAPGAARWLPAAAGAAALLAVIAGLGFWWLGRAPEPVPAVVLLPAPLPLPALAPLPPAPSAQPAPPAPPPQMPRVVSAPAAPRAPAAPAEPAPLALAELPAALRSELPALTVSGSTWSDSPARRFVIINGQLVREGEAAATGVLLERIDRKTAVLRWRDMRIVLPL